MGIRTIVVVAFTCLLGASFSSRPAGVQESDGQKWAVLVGVNDYGDLNDLAYCRADAKDLRGQLMACGFPKDNIVLLADGAGEQRHLPFKKNIERQQELVLSGTEKGDLALVSFSGHGVHVDGKSYFCPSEVPPQKRPIAAKSGWISVAPPPFRPC